LDGAKQQVIIIELALELPSEIIVGKDGSPSLIGQDIGTIKPVSEAKEWLNDPSSLGEVFFNSDPWINPSVFYKCIP